MYLTEKLDYMPREYNKNILSISYCLSELYQLRTLESYMEFISYNIFRVKST